MPELPEMEAWRRELDGPVSAFPIEQAGPAHIATLKTFDPPLSALEGRLLAGAERRAKRLLFPTEDGELVLLVHLMTAGRLRYLASRVRVLDPEPELAALVACEQPVEQGCPHVADVQEPGRAGSHSHADGSAHRATMVGGC